MKIWCTSKRAEPSIVHQRNVHPQPGNVLVFPRVSNPVWKLHGYLDFSNLISRYAFVFGVQEAGGLNLILLNRLNSLSGKKLFLVWKKNAVGEGIQFIGLAVIFTIRLRETSQKAWAAILSQPPHFLCPTLIIPVISLTSSGCFCSSQERVLTCDLCHFQALLTPPRTPGTPIFYCSLCITASIMKDGNEA